MGLTADLKVWRDGILADVQNMQSNVAANIRIGRVVDVPFVMGAQGSPLSTGTLLFMRMGLNGPATILSWSMAALVGGSPASSSITIDLRSGGSLGSLASICGGAPPALSGSSEQTEVLPVGWNAALADPSWLLAVITATDGVVEVVGLTLRVAVDPRG